MQVAGTGNLTDDDENVEALEEYNDKEAEGDSGEDNDNGVEAEEGKMVEEVDNDDKADEGSLDSEDFDEVTA
jgi:hypothetical protein